MDLIANSLYKEDLSYVSNLCLPWEKLSGKTIFVAGAAGLIGSFLIDVLMEKNQHDALDCHVIAVGRNKERARSRFAYCFESPLFSFLAHDINIPAKDIGLKPDFILQLASNTHPLAYSNDPVGTVTTNVIGTDNLLRFAAENGCFRFLFASSNEIYGENRGDVVFFDESYLGYIDCNTMRAGYPESKRCAEALCQAYRRQYGLDIVIPRLTRSYGPTLLASDSKALSQFLKKGLAGEDIVLKSEGNQYYSYSYVADSVSGLLTVLLGGNDGEAYNVADEKGDIQLKDLARIIADHAGTEVVFDLPDENEKAGYSTATKARLDGTKLKALGWQMRYDIKSGVERTLDIMKAMGS